VVLSNDGLVFIQEREYCKLKAYRDSADIWTIGWGTTIYPTGHKVREGDIINQAEADTYLLFECDGISIKLGHMVNANLEQHEQDALISLSYNIGVQAFKTSTLLVVVNKGLPVIEDHFTRWNKIHKDGKLVPLAGLTDRRKKEFRLYDQGDYGRKRD